MRGSRCACISGAAKKKPDARQAARRAPPWSVAETEAPLALVLHWGELQWQHKEEVSQCTTLSCIATTFEWLLSAVFSIAVYALVSRPIRIGPASHVPVVMVAMGRCRLCEAPSIYAKNILNLISLRSMERLSLASTTIRAFVRVTAGSS